MVAYAIGTAESDMCMANRIAIAGAATTDNITPDTTTGPITVGVITAGQGFTSVLAAKRLLFLKGHRSAAKL